MRRDAGILAGLVVTMGSMVAHADPSAGPSTGAPLPALCAAASELAAHVRIPTSEAESAEDAAWFAAHVGFPLILSTVDHSWAEGLPDYVAQRMIHSPEELSTSPYRFELAPPAAFLARCRSSQTADEVRVGEVAPRIEPGLARVDFARGPEAVSATGDDATVRWRSAFSPSVFALSLHRDGAAWRLTGTTVERAPATALATAK